MKQMRISRGGQVSIPAEVRHRWGTERVLLDDLGDRLVLRPLPEDPIGAARGYLRPHASETAVTSDAARWQLREEEATKEMGAEV